MRKRKSFVQSLLDNGEINVRVAHALQVFRIKSRKGLIKFNVPEVGEYNYISYFNIHTYNHKMGMTRLRLGKRVAQEIKELKIKFAS